MIVCCGISPYFLLSPFSAFLLRGYYGCEQIYGAQETNNTKRRR